MKMKKLSTLAIAMLMATSFTTTASSAEQKRTYQPIPDGFTTPNKLETSIGTLNYFDGMPTDATAKLAYDELDKLRAKTAYIDNIQLASMEGLRRGHKDAGINKINDIIIYDKRMDSVALWLTGNTDTVNVMGWLDLKRDGHSVIEIPPGTGPSIVNDADQRWVIDMGIPGPDNGKGGTYVVLSPDYKDGDIEELKGKDIPNEGTILTEMNLGGETKSVYVARSRSYNNWVLFRGFLKDGKSDYSANIFRTQLKMYALKDAKNPPPINLMPVSRKYTNTLPPLNEEYYEFVNRSIQAEHPGFLSPERLGTLSSIGIRKGEKFNPDERMQGILKDAAHVGDAIARTISFANRDDIALYWKGKQWHTFFPGLDYKWYRKGNPDHGFDVDARLMFMYQAIVNTPAMVAKMVGKGSQYAGVERDINGDYLDGGKTYKLTVPANVPAKDFWSMVLYDTQTRSQLQTNQIYPSINSKTGKFNKNADGSVDIFFAPKAPKGQENNWVQTVSGKGWSAIFRLYGPLDPWFDKAWELPDLELVD